MGAPTLVRMRNCNCALSCTTALPDLQMGLMLAEKEEAIRLERDERRDLALKLQLFQSKVIKSKSNQIKSHQIKSYQNQIKPSQTKPNQAKPNQTKYQTKL